MENYAFYPELTEQGKEEAQLLMSSFKVKAKEVLENLIDDYCGRFYCEIAPEIESDSWQNFRNKVMDGYKDYGNKELKPYDFKDIRQQLYKENKAEIDKDLNQDNLDKIRDLEQTIEFLQQRHY